MSFHILSDQNNVWERTILYQTFYENFVVFIQQKRTNEKEENWTTLEHFMIPKIFINFIATLPDKKESEDCGGTFITSVGFVPPLSLTHPLYPYDIVTLPKETRTILYNYDCDCVPFFENQLGVVRACNDLADLWGLPHSPESPPPTPGCVSTPTSDPSATVTPESSPSLFSPVTEEKLAWNFGSLPTASQLMQNLSATDFRTPSGSTTPTTILETGASLVATATTTTTPDNSETPKVTLAPRKRRSIGPCEKLFD